MGDLSQYREKIDEIDAQLVKLYEERMAVSEKVAAYKIETGKKVFDHEREAQKLAAVQALAGNEFNRHGVKELFEQIMAMSRKKQYQLMQDAGGMHRLPFMEIDHLDFKDSRVVYQGARGSYSEAAMKAFFGEDVKNFAVESFRDAMTAIEEGAADYAVLPIENSTAGVVSAIYDLLVEYENFIVAEQIIAVEHCLIASKGTTIDSIQTVYSHAQSLMQSERFLSQHTWQQVPMLNNAFAAQKVAEEKNPTQAAIASAYAAKTYGLEVLKQGINQATNNSTRFIIVTNQKVFLKGANKISICLEIPHESGSLYHILSHFIYNNLNMSKIESRPIEERNWEYRFFIDFDGNLNDSAVKNCLRGLRDESRNMKILGNYERS